MSASQIIVTRAIASGISEETIILLVLLPLVASLVAATRHLIGFRGFGIFIPTAIAVTFVAAGILPGLFIFLAVLLLATFSRWALRRLRLHYLPRMALFLWLVTLGILTLIFVAPYLSMSHLTGISILPIVILILLAEEFIEVQIGKSFKEAIRLTAETMIIALAGYFVFSLQFLKELAFNYPHWVFLAPLVLNLLVGKFSGLRLLEYLRFKDLLKK